MSLFRIADPLELSQELTTQSRRRSGKSARLEEAVVRDFGNIKTKRKRTGIWDPLDQGSITYVLRTFVPDVTFSFSSLGNDIALSYSLQSIFDKTSDIVSWTSYRLNSHVAYLHLDDNQTVLELVQYPLKTNSSTPVPATMPAAAAAAAADSKQTTQQQQQQQQQTSGLGSKRSRDTASSDGGSSTTSGVLSTSAPSATIVPAADVSEDAIAVSAVQEAGGMTPEAGLMPASRRTTRRGGTGGGSGGGGSKSSSAPAAARSSGGASASLTGTDAFSPGMAGGADGGPPAMVLEGPAVSFLASSRRPKGSLNQAASSLSSSSSSSSSASSSSSTASTTTTTASSSSSSSSSSNSGSGAKCAKEQQSQPQEGASAPAAAMTMTAAAVKKEPTDESPEIAARPGRPDDPRDDGFDARASGLPPADDFRDQLLYRIGRLTDQALDMFDFMTVGPLPRSVVESLYTDLSFKQIEWSKKGFRIYPPAEGSMGAGARAALAAALEPGEPVDFVIKKIIWRPRGAARPAPPAPIAAPGTKV